jgi:hypothetical protein
LVSKSPFSEFLEHENTGFEKIGMNKGNGEVQEPFEVLSKVDPFGAT